MISDRETLLPKQQPVKAEEPFKPWKIWKNVIILTLAFTLNNSAYSALQSIQSSLYRQEGLGTTGLSISYVSYAISSLLLAPLMIKLCTYKWSIVAGFLSFLLWIVAIGIGTWTSIIFTSIILGIFSASLYTAQGGYLTELARCYAEASDQSMDKIRMTFFSVLVIYLPLSFLTGNALVAFILNEKQDFGNNTLSSGDMIKFCGINDCPSRADEQPASFQAPSSYQLYALIGACFVLSALAIMVTSCGLDSLSQIGSHCNKNRDTLSLRETYLSLVSVFKTFQNYKMLLLLPATSSYAIFSSLQYSTFNSSWVTCTHGMWMVGLVSIPGYMIAVPASLGSGYVSKRFGRTIPMLSSLIIGFSTCALLYLWPIDRQNAGSNILISVLFSLCIYILDPILEFIPGSHLFEDTDAAFSCYHLVWAGVSAAAYFYSYSLCNDVKILITAFSFILSYPCYFLLEFHFLEKA